MRRLPLTVSFLLFIALCASVAYWAMQLFKPPVRPVAAPPRVAQAEIRPDAAATLFGNRKGNAAPASNYQLRGVIFSGSPRDSVAIISADGKPPVAIRVDMEVAPDVKVKEVHRDYVLLSDGGATKRIDLPESAKGLEGLAAAPAAARPAAPSPAAPPAATRPATPPPAATPQIPVPGQPVPTRAQAAAAAQGAPQPAPPVQPNQPAQPGLTPQTAPSPPQAAQPAVPPPMTTAPPTTVVSPPPAAPGATAVPAPPPAAPPVPSTQQSLPGVPPGPMR